MAKVVSSLGQGREVSMRNKKVWLEDEILEDTLENEVLEGMFEVGYKSDIDPEMETQDAKIFD